jgi:prephenate dehydratase
MNLTKIQSFPVQGEAWQYLFYIDLAFEDAARYRQALDAVIPLTRDLKVLGEY